jgi:ABC-type multidrug transport system fused ATPase/permease subunit
MELRLVTKLLVYAARIRPSVIGATLFGCFSSAVELAALVSLVPLSTLGAGHAIASGSFWYRIPTALGFHPSARFFAIAFLSLLLLRAITAAAASLMTQRVFRSLIAHFSSRALDAFVHHLSFAQVQKESIGHFITLGGDEANRAAQIVMAVMRLVPLIALFVFYGITIFYQSWVFGLGLLAVLAVSVVLLPEAFRKSHALGKRQQDQSRALNTHFIESLNGLRTVRSFTGERYVSRRYEEMIAAYAWTCFSIDALNLLAALVPSLVLTTALLVATVGLASESWLTQNLPTIFVGAMMVFRLLPLATQTLDAALRLTADLRAAGNVSTMLNAIETSKTTEAVALPAMDERIARIDFDHITFRYDPELPLVFDDFSASFRAGRSYAICGPSGVGKSSLIDLLLKFYRPAAGTICVNGTDIREISDLSLRQRIAVTEQVTRIFYDTVLHNVLFGRQTEPSEAMRAIEDAGLAPFVSTLPNGVETLLTYQGSNLSGGQRQRLGLARALLGRADVVILDESTNALDHATREAVVSRLLDEYRDRILIFVTHDPYVVGRVDEVVRLDAVRSEQKAALVAE